MILDSKQCSEIHERNKGNICWLDYLACNDGRLILKNEFENLHIWLSSEWDAEEQAQAARLCGAVNMMRSKYRVEN